MRLLILCLCLSGCAHTGPRRAALFVDPLPALEVLPDQTVTPAVDACPAPQALIPGEPTPFVRDGLATCRALILPEHEVARVLSRSQGRDYWEGIAQIEHTGRALDRLIAEDAYAIASEGREAALADARRLRVALPLGAVGGVVAGVVLGAFGAWLGAEMVGVSQ